jgi:hypothetical protein
MCLLGCPERSTQPSVLLLSSLDSDVDGLARRLIVHLSLSGQSIFLPRSERRKRSRPISVIVRPSDRSVGGIPH